MANRLPPSGPPVDSYTPPELYLAQVALTDTTPAPGAMQDLAIYLGLPDPSDWEIIADGGPGANSPALLMPAAALGNIVKITGQFRVTSADVTNPYNAAMAIQLYDEEATTMTQLVGDSQYRYSANTTETLTLVLTWALDLRTVTERRNAQILIQAQAQNMITHVPSFGGTLIFEVEPVNAAA